MTVPGGIGSKTLVGGNMKRLLIGSLMLCVAMPAIAQTQMPVYRDRSGNFQGAEGVVVLNANGTPSTGGASGPQPSASSQSVTPANDGAAFPVTGTVADGGADSGGVVKVGGVYSSATAVPLLTVGARAPIQMDGRGNIRTVVAQFGLVPADGGTIVGTSARIVNNADPISIVPSGALGYVWTGTALAMARGDTSGTYVIGKGGANMATGQVSAGTTATLIAAARTGRQNIQIIVGAANACAVGNAGVTLTTGYLLPAVAGTTDTSITAGALYAVCSATTTISFKELF